MSSKRAIRRKQCDRKRRYADAAAAQEALRDLQANRRSARLVRPYGCQFCMGFHLGHPMRRKRTRRKDFV